MLPPTIHGIERQNLRGISDQAIDLALAYGKRQRVKDGVGFHVSPHLVKRLRRSVPELEHARNLHVIVDSTESTIITVYFNRRCQFIRDYKPRNAC
jgi:hypothetical protein